MPRLKVCCIANEQEARMALAAGAHALGLVGPMPSGPGALDEGRIAQIIASLPGGVQTYLLSSETEPDRLMAQVARANPTTLQLVDRPQPSVYRSLRLHFPALSLVQVVHVQDEQALSEARRVAPMVDAILLDSGRPDRRVKELGGTGRTHDWTISRRIVESVAKPVWLAGGLRPENIRQAVEQVRPYGVDVCSGVRRQGRLDAVRLRAFSEALQPEG